MGSPTSDNSDHLDPAATAVVRLGGDGYLIAKLPETLSAGAYDIVVNIRSAGPSGAFCLSNSCCKSKFVSVEGNEAVEGGEVIEGSETTEGGGGIVGPEG